MIRTPVTWEVNVLPVISPSLVGVQLAILDVFVMNVSLFIFKKNIHISTFSLSTLYLLSYRSYLLHSIFFFPSLTPAYCFPARPNHIFSHSVALPISSFPRNPMNLILFTVRRDVNNLSPRRNEDVVFVLVTTPKHIVLRLVYNVNTCWLLPRQT